MDPPGVARRHAHDSSPTARSLNQVNVYDKMTFSCGSMERELTREELFESLWDRIVVELERKPF